MKDELAKLKGSWTTVMMDRGHGPESAESIAEKYGMRLTFDGANFSMIGLKHGPDSMPEKYTITAIDQTAKPATLTMERQLKDGTKQTFQMIYELDGDTLKLCFGQGIHDPLPKEFKASTANLLLGLKRDK